MLDLDDHVIVVADQAGIEAGIADRHVDEMPTALPGAASCPSVSAQSATLGKVSGG